MLSLMTDIEECYRQEENQIIEVQISIPLGVDKHDQEVLDMDPPYPMDRPL